MRQVVRGQPHSNRQSLLNWLAWITVALPAQATYVRTFANMFALRLRGPFSAGLRAGLTPCTALWNAVSTLTRPLQRLYLMKLGWIIREKRGLSRCYQG